MTERPVGAPSLFEDLLDVLYQPAAVFERRRDTAAFGLALLVVTLLIVGLSFAFKGVMEPIFDVEFKRGMVQAMKQNPQLTPEMMEQGKGFAKKFMVVGIGLYALLTPLLLGLVAWFVGKLFGAKADPAQAMMVATYAMVPRVLESVIGAVQILALPESSITSRYSISFGVARFLDVDTLSPMVLALVGRLDLFTLWVTAIIAIGVAVLGRLPMARALVVGLLVWCVGALPAIWGALRAG